MMGHSGLGEIAVPVNVDTDVKHFSEQLELLFLFQHINVLVPLSPLNATSVSSPIYSASMNSVLMQMFGFRDIFNCNKVISEIFQKCDVSFCLLFFFSPLIKVKGVFWTFHLCCMYIIPIYALKK